ncbi:hypothetical protein BC828DRAFT_377489 [Blastocladiella britannica]|nr:hypothetical protein BC828DRAFT_377489 [Blastocladiella britannica]
MRVGRLSTDAWSTARNKLFDVDHGAKDETLFVVELVKDEIAVPPTMLRQRVPLRNPKARRAANGALAASAPGPSDTIRSRQGSAHTPNVMNSVAPCEKDAPGSGLAQSFAAAPIPTPAPTPAAVVTPPILAESSSIATTEGDDNDDGELNYGDDFNHSYAVTAHEIVGTGGKWVISMGSHPGAIDLYMTTASEYEDAQLKAGARVETVGKQSTTRSAATVTASISSTSAPAPTTGTGSEVHEHPPSQETSTAPPSSSPLLTSVFVDSFAVPGSNGGGGIRGDMPDSAVDTTTPTQAALPWDGPLSHALPDSTSPSVRSSREMGPNLGRQTLAQSASSGQQQFVGGSSSSSDSLMFPSIRPAVLLEMSALGASDAGDAGQSGFIDDGNRSDELLQPHLSHESSLASLDWGDADNDIQVSSVSPPAPSLLTARVPQPHALLRSESSSATLDYTTATYPMDAAAAATVGDAPLISPLAAALRHASQTPILTIGQIHTLMTTTFDAVYGTAFVAHVTDPAHVELAARALRHLAPFVSLRHLAQIINWMVARDIERETSVTGTSGGGSSERPQVPTLKQLADAEHAPVGVTLGLGWPMVAVAKLMLTLTFEWTADVAGLVIGYIGQSWPVAALSKVVTMMVQDEPPTIAALFVKSATWSWSLMQLAELISLMDCTLHWRERYFASFMVQYYAYVGRDYQYSLERRPVVSRPPPLTITAPRESSPIDPSPSSSPVPPPPPPPLALRTVHHPFQLGRDPAAIILGRCPSTRTLFLTTLYRTSIAVHQARLDMMAASLPHRALASIQDPVVAAVARAAGPMPPGTAAVARAHLAQAADAATTNRDDSSNSSGESEDRAFVTCDSQEAEQEVEGDAGDDENDGWEVDGMGGDLSASDASLARWLEDRIRERSERGARTDPDGGSDDEDDSESSSDEDSEDGEADEA